MVSGTRETLPCTAATRVKSEPINLERAKGQAARRESEREVVPRMRRTTKPRGGKLPYFVHVCEEVRVSECGDSC